MVTYQYRLADQLGKFETCKYEQAEAGAVKMSKASGMAVLIESVDDETGKVERIAETDKCGNVNLNIRGLDL